MIALHHTPTLALQRIVEDFPLWQRESVENGESAPLFGLFREFFPTNA
jgi:hypothetical protein